MLNSYVWCSGVVGVIYSGCEHFLHRWVSRTLLPDGCILLVLIFIRLLDLLFYLFLFGQTEWASTPLEWELESGLLDLFRVFLIVCCCWLSCWFGVGFELRRRQRWRCCPLLTHENLKSCLLTCTRCSCSEILQALLLSSLIWSCHTLRRLYVVSSRASIKSLLYSFDILHNSVTGHFFRKLVLTALLTL